MIAAFQPSDTYPDDLFESVDVEFWNAVGLKAPKSHMRILQDPTHFADN